MRASQVARLRADIAARLESALGTLGEGSEDETFADLFLTSLEASRSNYLRGLGVKPNNHFHPVDPLDPIETERAALEALESRTGPIREEI